MSRVARTDLGHSALLGPSVFHLGRRPRYDAVVSGRAERLFLGPFVANAIADSESVGGRMGSSGAKRSRAAIGCATTAVRTIRSVPGVGGLRNSHVGIHTPLTVASGTAYRRP